MFVFLKIRMVVPFGFPTVQLNLVKFLYKAPIGRCKYQPTGEIIFKKFTISTRAGYTLSSGVNIVRIKAFKIKSCNQSINSKYFQQMHDTKTIHRQRQYWSEGIFKFVCGLPPVAIRLQNPLSAPCLEYILGSLTIRTGLSTEIIN